MSDTEAVPEAKKAKLDEEDMKNGLEAGAGDQKLMELPRKKFYRQRAHANPLSIREMFHPDTPQT